MKAPRSLPLPLEELEALPVLEGISRLGPGVVVVDGSGRVAWASGGPFGRHEIARRVVGRPWRELLRNPSQADAMVRRIREGSVWNERVDVELPDGRMVALDVAAASLCRPGEPSSIVALVRAAEPRDELAAEIRRTVDWLSAILDSAPDPVVVADPDGRLQYASPAVQWVLGFSPGEVLGRRIEEFLVREEDASALARALEPQHRALRREVELRHRDGSSVWASVSASPLRLADGRIVGVVAYFRDETDRRGFEQQLERKNAELEQTVRAVAHDVRGPLVSVLGFSRLLTEDFGEALGERGRHYLERITQAGRTMEALIRELLDFARIGEAPERAELVNPREVLTQLASELKTQLDERGIALQIPSECPPVRCERTRLYQLFSNLLRNAIEHMGPSDHPVIRVDVSEDDDAWHVVVADNGRGVPEPDRERIFGMFETARRKEGVAGSGIGLAIVKKIAEVYGGRAWVDERRGGGAAFHVTLARS